MIKIEEKQKRDNLSEGRHYGFGFAILKQNTKNSYKTINAFTSCKDYLNDLVYVEQTKNELDKIHGFQHKLTNIFDKKRFFYLGVKGIGYNNNLNRECKVRDDVKKTLINNKENLVKFINKLEEYIDITVSRTTIINYDNDILILKAPIFWAKYGFLISLYTLFIRCYSTVTIEFLNKDIVKNINNFKKTLIPEDEYFLKTIQNFFLIKNLKKEIDTFKYPNPLTEKVKTSVIHNGGIKNWVNKILIKQKKKEI